MAEVALCAFVVILELGEQVWSSETLQRVGKVVTVKEVVNIDNYDTPLHSGIFEAARRRYDLDGLLIG